MHTAPCNVSHSCHVVSSSSVFFKTKHSTRASACTKQVVVLEEIGLAEMSPDMPLKILHDKFDNATKKVGFVAMSNWNLDPSKMNRGFFVTRSMPTAEDLFDTMMEFAAAAAQSRDVQATSSSRTEESRSLTTQLREVLGKLAPTFLLLVGEMSQRKEFPQGAYFALRDVYSCVNQLCETALAEGGLQLESVLHAIHRSFSRLPQYAQADVDGIFYDMLAKLQGEELLPSGIAASSFATLRPSGMVLLREAFFNPEGSRYPLAICDNPIQALTTMQKCDVIPKDAYVICGSGFAKDQWLAHTQRVIREMKVVLNSGRPLVLLYMESSLESLYDLLNKFYSEYSGRRFVDLGIGHARVKVDVHHDFKMMVLADYSDSYGKFPPPLLNRFEKHRFGMLGGAVQLASEFPLDLEFALMDVQALRPKRPRRICSNCVTVLHRVAGEASGHEFLGDQRPHGL